MATSSTDRMRALRARRAALIEAAPGGAVRDVDELLAPAVAETIGALKLGPEYEAAAAVALRYAETIDRAADQAWAMRWLGPLLLASLEALQATPRSRPAARPGPQSSRPGRVSQLRADHAKRMRGRAG